MIASGILLKTLSCLFVKMIFIVSVWDTGKSNYSQGSCKWPELEFHWLWFELSRQLVDSLHITNSWRSCLLKHIWQICTNTETVFYLQPVYLSKKASNQFICPRRHLYLVCIAGIQWRSSFVFRSTGISSFINSLLLANSMHGPDYGSFIERILCLVKVTSFQSSEPTWKSFVSLVRTRCSISFPLVPQDHRQRDWWFLPRILLQLDFLQWDPAFPHMQHLLLSAHAGWLRCCL